MVLFSNQRCAAKRSDCGFNCESVIFSSIILRTRYLHSGYRNTTTSILSLQCYCARWMIMMNTKSWVVVLDGMHIRVYGYFLFSSSLSPVPLLLFLLPCSVRISRKFNTANKMYKREKKLPSQLAICIITALLFHFMRYRDTNCHAIIILTCYPVNHDVVICGMMARRS